MLYCFWSLGFLFYSFFRTFISLFALSSVLACCLLFSNKDLSILIIVLRHSLFVILTFLPYLTLVLIHSFSSSCIYFLLVCFVIFLLKGGYHVLSKINCGKQVFHNATVNCEEMRGVQSYYY